jgi:hypothetical protein
MSVFYPAEAPMLPLAPESDVPPPPGLMGEVASFIYDAATRPVPEIAIAGAIGFLAGIAGRAFNVSGTGLNQYVLLLAPTGRGKEAIASGVSKLVQALRDPMAGYPYCSQVTFVGPADMASGPGLLKAIAKLTPPSFVSIVGEFGLRFKQMADDRAHSADTSLLRVLLDLYNKSGQGNVVGETVYSDRDKNTAAIVAPAVSLIGESTPDTFYGYLSEGMIANGLLPRFTIIEYTGPRPRRNRNAEFVQPPVGMMQRLAALVAVSNAENAANRAKPVKLTPDAEAYLDELDRYCDDQINDRNSHGVTAELWNRAHIKALKLSALIAVGCNHDAPIVTLDMAQWARAQIERDVRRLLERFESGEVGEVAGSEVQQEAAVLECLAELLDSRQPNDRFAAYGLTAAMRADNVFTKTYLSKRLLNRPVFKRGPIGSIHGTPALTRAIENLKDADDIRELPKQQTAERYGTNARAYVMSNPTRFIEAGRKKFGARV